MSIDEVVGAPVPTVIGGVSRSARHLPPGSLVRVALLVDAPARMLPAWREHPEFEIAVVAATWLELIHSAAFPADLVVLDTHLREPVSIAARVRTCRAAGARVIVLSGEAVIRDDALLAGAAAALAVPATAAEVLAAARIAMGLSGAGPVQRSWWPAAVGVSPRPRLSAGETIALRSYASGRSVKEVAVELGVQYETAKTYLRRIREKYARLGREAGRRADLVARAAEDGYL